MEVMTPGHKYALNKLDSNSLRNTITLSFVDRGHGSDKPGVTCQEVLRALIDRVGFLESELHWERNKEILYHLRKSLLLFEIRALERKFEKDELKPEEVVVDPKDGHFKLTNK